jgi:hypothetical protein
MGVSPHIHVSWSVQRPPGVSEDDLARELNIIANRAAWLSYKGELPSEGVRAYLIKEAGIFLDKFTPTAPPFPEEEVEGILGPHRAEFNAWLGRNEVPFPKTMEVFQELWSGFTRFGMSNQNAKETTP